MQMNNDKNNFGIHEEEKTANEKVLTSYTRHVPEEVAFEH